MNDLISRQAAKEQLVKTCNDVADKLYEWEGCFGYCDTVMGIVDCLDDIPAAHPITENDLIELQDRYGDEVRFVVEDMLSGKENRWMT